ncbi:hypothetical protein TCAL_07329 [Tigriopus californicus]|uniref:C2H2-type domain-containing protein n=1 Tax=Tigriopus californicus TaxID=6832 RepID=A0A553NYU6_TIGCA|nr:histone H4 transcription factor-like [Tigriopus californicus]TRY70594.1 hypothetical protein TCAL_07329 [Tigriopus californicus]|eukprot:TCALIF_07329-PA protein Name:"Similar to Hinfp Histone H4 transcription factor (Mus musculus)" AED:0.03 eAED:0.03 QI:0/-1/0/1/-1/1/1/0/428
MVTPKAMKPDFISKTRLVTPLSKLRGTAPDDLVLECEWEACSEPASSNLLEYLSHVSGHLKDVTVRLTESGDSSTVDRVFVCLWQECGFETPRAREMIRHINYHAYHTKIKWLGRMAIEKAGLNRCNLDDHQRNCVPDVTMALKCGWVGCDMGVQEFEEVQKFYWHVDSHGEEMRHVKGEIACQWADCQVKVGSASKLKGHLKTHSQERAVGCPNCGGLFASRFKLMDHCDRQILGDSHKCSYCNKGFANERLLRDHMRSHVNHYKCPYCDMTCATPSNLVSHINYRHNEERPCECHVCGKAFKTESALKSHLRSHLSTFEEVCPYEGCEFSRRSRKAILNHIRRDHEKLGGMYLCHLCDKRFTCGENLSRHLIRVHKFKLPSGHSRFRYKKDDEGFYHLQTVRFESEEVCEPIAMEEEEEVEPESDF